MVADMRCTMQSPMMLWQPGTQRAGAPFGHQHTVA